MRQCSGLNPDDDGATSLIRHLAVLTMLAPLTLTIAGCGPSYSPNTYATNAAQQANKVEPGVIAGVRKVRISASGTVGGVAGAGAGGVAGAQVGTGTASAFAAIGGSLIGGIAGVATEHIIGDTNGFEYIVRKANGEMVSVVQKDEKALWVGEKVLVIAGAQARIVADYTVPFDAPDKTSGKPAQPPVLDGTVSHPAVTVTPVPPPAGVPAPPPVVSPAEVHAAPAPASEAVPKS